MKEIYAMLPCYNEMDDIDALVRKWINLKGCFLLQGYILNVYCIDDKSTDDTKNVIYKLVEEFPEEVHLVEHPVNKGLGGAVMTGFNLFNEIGRMDDICILMDGDNTHDPVYVLDMVAKIEEGFDCVIASRYRDNSKTKGVTLIRLMMSWGARLFYSIVLRIKDVRDYTCGYRAYSYALIQRGMTEYGNDLVERRSFACMMEILYKFSLIGAKFYEIPFELQYCNKKGKSKMKILNTVKESVKTAMQLARKTRNDNTRSFIDSGI